jgi:hypothetical protein
MDDLVNDLPQQGVDILYTFGWPPSWAATCSTCPPTNIQDWDDFVTALVNRYHTRVKYLEVWNEAQDSGFYSGTIAQLVQLAQHLDSIAKSIDPTITVLTPSAAGGPDRIIEFFQKYFAAGGAAYADVINFHGYGAMSGHGTHLYAEEIFHHVANVKTEMNAYGVGPKPIWDTEANWGDASNEPTHDDCIAWMARHYLLEWSLGVSVCAWYMWDMNEAAWDWGQLWTSSGGINAAGVAYHQLYNWMVGATMSQPCTTANGSTYTCGFTRPGGYQALAVWDTNAASTSTFSVPNGYVQYRDLAGNLSQVSGATVTIGKIPILLENQTASSISYNRPNPALRATSVANGPVALYNMRGQMVVQHASAASVLRGKEQALPRGVYLMHAQAAGQAASSRIVWLP